MQLNKISIEKMIILFLFFFCSMSILQFKGKTIFLYLEILIFVYMLIRKKRIIILEDKIINGFFFFEIVTCICSFIYNIPDGYKKASFRNTWTSLLCYFVLAYLIYILKNRKEYLYIVKKTIKVALMINVIWCNVQFLFFDFFSMDINNVIFRDILKCVSNASAYKNNKLLPSGLAWHPGCMAPIITISYFLFDNIFIKCFIVFTAFITGNTTCMIGACLCIGADIILLLYKNKVLNKKLKIFIVLFCIAILAMIVTKKYNVIFDKIFEIYNKITGNIDVNSVTAHKTYFTEYPNVVKNSNIIQILCGYGGGCSGYIFTKLKAYQPNALSWSVECDIMDILISRGLVGFLFFYSFIFKLIKKGIKINIKYSFTFIFIVIQGITYQVQFGWVVLLEMVFYFMIISGYDIYNMNNNEEKNENINNCTNI